MNSTSQLVEHFFRHEYGRLVAMLTSRLGAANLQIVEDAVQTALSRALSNWPRNGVPDNPSAWLYRSANNAALDALRHQNMVNRVLSTQAQSKSIEHSADNCEQQLDDLVSDQTLRLLFLCCHGAIPEESRIALALKIVGGFSTHEIGLGLYTTAANIEKRITRAKEKLRENQAELVELDSQAVTDRLESVQTTIYLMFNEGFAASSGQSPIRHELCEEAVRLSRMLANHPICTQPTTCALLALLLFHSARLGERVDATGSIVLLEDQARTHWNWSKVREAMDWMEQSAQGDQLSRFHIEAAIAWEHNRAESFNATDWPRILGLYQMLYDHFPSPSVRLNLAIASSYAIDLQSGLTRLLEIPVNERRVLRPWWDCAMAQILKRNQQISEAISHWRDAMALATNDAQRRMISHRLDQII